MTRIDSNRPQSAVPHRPTSAPWISHAHETVPLRSWKWRVSVGHISREATRKSKALRFSVKLFGKMISPSQGKKQSDFHASSGIRTHVPVLCGGEEILRFRACRHSYRRCNKWRYIIVKLFFLKKGRCVQYGRTTKSDTMVSWREHTEAWESQWSTVSRGYWIVWCWGMCFIIWLIYVKVLR
jgi:hypothetical protein